MSRPTSYISHAGHEDGDPWAIQEAAGASHFSYPDQPGAARTIDDSSAGEDELTDGDDFSYSPQEPQDDTVGVGEPATSSIRQSRSHESPASPPVAKHAAQPSGSSSTDPWGTRSPRSSHTRSPPPQQRFSSIPNTSSAFRGGFSTTSNGAPSHHDRPSSPYDVARSDTLAQKSTLAHLKSQPGPWDNDEVFVSLRPELEGLIFKYNSYNVTRKPRPATPDTAKLAGPSKGSTLAYARSAQQQRSPTTPAQSSSSPDSYVLESRQTVVRRYSDFVWLNEILVKRYPFRIVPILPPKRLTIPVAGRHLSSDEGFMERRRRGLQRYLRALTAHPVLGRDELVQIFLTEKQPLAEWKQSHNPSTEEEAFTSPPQPSALLSIPSDLGAKLEQTTNHTSAMVEKWTAFVNLFERICKRLEAQGLDFSRLASQLDSLTTVNHSCFKPESDPSDHSSSMRETSSRMGGLNRDFSDLCTARAKGAGDGTLEQLKTQRDLWMAFRDLIARHTALATDNVTTLKQRISTSRGKVSNLRNTPMETRAASYHADVDKLEASIQADSLQVESLLKRREFIRLYMWQELNWLWKSRTEPTELAWKQWCREELVGKSAEKQAVEECWRDLGGH